MNDTDIRLARFTDDNRAIIDSDGNRIRLDDPRVVFIWTVPSSPYLTELLSNIFQKRGLKFRACGGVGNEILQYGKNICSGKECLAFSFIAGAVYKDLMNSRSNNEISVYVCFDQIGPCVNGAWPVIFDIFAGRYRTRNVIYMAWFTKRTNFLGHGTGFLRDYFIANVLADIIHEAESSLKCLAKYKDEAMKVFEIETDKLAKSIGKGTSEIKIALKRWAFELSKIPRESSLEETPKILLFGGMNVLFTHYPITEYFDKQDVIVKRIDMAEGIIFVISEGLVIGNLRRGRVSISLQFSKSQYLKSLIKFGIRKFLKPILKMNKKEREELKALNSWLGIRFIESMIKKFRRIARPSGLLFDEQVPFEKIAIRGHEFLTDNAPTESGISVGRYLNSAENGIFDGLLNLGTFNCQPYQNSLAVIRSLASKREIPFVSIDCDGGELSSNQIRLLETLTMQAKRAHNKRLAA